MREIARPEVKRRRRFKLAVVAVVPEPRVADKYYAQKKTCRMVELGIKVPGCKGTFVPRGNEMACSPACRDKLDRYHNKKSAKKNFPKHRDAINTAARRRHALRVLERGKPPGRTCQRPGCMETYYSWHPAKKFCSSRCHRINHNEVKKQRRQQQPKPAKIKSCRAPHPTGPGELCGKKFRVGKGNGRQVYCSLKCRMREWYAANRERLNAEALRRYHAKKRTKDRIGLTAA